MDLEAAPKAKVCAVCDAAGPEMGPYRVTNGSKMTLSNDPSGMPEPYAFWMHLDLVRTRFDALNARSEFQNGRSRSGAHARVGEGCWLDDEHSDY